MERTAVACFGRITAFFVLYMMGRKVTALKKQKRNAQRINVYLDGEFAFGLSRYAAAWLQVGQELSPEKIQELQEVDAQEWSMMLFGHFQGGLPAGAEFHQLPPSLGSGSAPEPAKARYP